MTNDIFLSPHFKLSEFVVSETASRHGIDNTPPEEAVENLRRLCQGTLEPLREALQLPVVITSGFRTKALNDRLAHSSERSQHMQGCAADFYVSCAAEPRGNAALPRFKVQGSRFKVRATQGSMTKIKVQGGGDAVQRAKIKVQSGFTAGQSGSEREGLIEELCRLRKLYPKAKILGVSELGEHCVHPSERMNQLRRELSDLGGGAAGQCGEAAVQCGGAAVQGSRFKAALPRFKVQGSRFKVSGSQPSVVELGARPLNFEL